MYCPLSTVHYISSGSQQHNTSSFAALTSSSLPTGVICGAVWSSSGCVCGVAYHAAQSSGSCRRKSADASITVRPASIDGPIGFVEWEMGLKIKGIEFVYPGATRLRFNADGKIIDHRDYFDFVGPTFGPVPVVGGFVRWLYQRFVT